MGKWWQSALCTCIGTQEPLAGKTVDYGWLIKGFESSCKVLKQSCSSSKFYSGYRKDKLSLSKCKQSESQKITYTASILKLPLLKHRFYRLITLWSVIQCLSYYYGRVALWLKRGLPFHIYLSRVLHAKCMLSHLQLFLWSFFVMSVF